MSILSFKEKDETWASSCNQFVLPVHLNGIQEGFDVFLLFLRRMTKDTSLCSHLVSCVRVDLMIQERNEEKQIETNRILEIEEEKT